MPEPLLDLLDAERLAWLVPGLRLEKITELLRALPKSLRKLFVPVPDSAKAIVSELPDLHNQAEQRASAVPRVARPGGDTTCRRNPDRLATGIAALPDHLRMNVRVIDEHDEVIAEGRDLFGVRREQRGASGRSPSIAGRLRARAATPQRARSTARRRAAPDVPRGRAGRPRAERPAVPAPMRVRVRVAVSAGARASSWTHANATDPLHAEHREWHFGELPETLDVERKRLRFRVFPALEDRGHSVTIVEARTAFEAEAITRRGLTRLALLALPQQAKFITQRISADRDLVLLSSGLNLAQPLPQAAHLARRPRGASSPTTCALPRTKEAFDALVESRRGDFCGGRRQTRGGDRRSRSANGARYAPASTRFARWRRPQQPASTQNSRPCCRPTSSNPHRANG